jgi:hypothetical protein
MKFIKHIFIKHRPIAVSILSIFALIVFIKIFATSAFNVGETTDPGCLPGAADCYVSPLGIGTSVSSGTANSVLFVDSTGKLAQDNTNFYYVNRASPGSGLYLNSLCLGGSPCQSSWPSGLSSVSTDGTLTGDGTSDHPLSVVGGDGTIISGLTENYLSKSNSPGNNIVNSQIFDNGTNVGIGTASPTLGLLQVAGHIATSGSHPSLTGGCGAGESIVGTDTAGKVTLGAATGTCIVTFASPYANPPACVITNSVSSRVYSATTTTNEMDISGSVTAFDVIMYKCVAI